MPDQDIVDLNDATDLLMEALEHLEGENASAADAFDLAKKIRAFMVERGFLQAEMSERG